MLVCVFVYVSVCVYVVCMCVYVVCMCGVYVWCVWCVPVSLQGAHEHHRSSVLGDDLLNS
jgi:hypothetical protein